MYKILSFLRVIFPVLTSFATFVFCLNILLFQNMVIIFECCFFQNHLLGANLLQKNMNHVVHECVPLLQYFDLIFVSNASDAIYIYRCKRHDIRLSM